MQKHSNASNVRWGEALLVFSSVLLAILSCVDDPVSVKDEPKIWSCSITDGTEPNYLTVLGCQADFKALASEPLDASIPGATSLKTIIDLQDPVKDNPLYFTNCKKYPIHFEFAWEHLSGNGLPIVQGLSQFNAEYYSINRRFLLGAISYYSGPKVWVYEIAPYDKASADMITKAYTLIADSCYFGDSLYFHPTSEAIATVAKGLPSTVKQISTDELYKGIDYQPLNCATSIGKLVFFKAADLETNYLSFRNIVVLDAVPNDISVAMGIITDAFQTPLAHINVLSQNRKTPNMGLRGAWTNSQLRALEGKWVELKVGPFEYTIKEVTKEVADAWWDANSPSAVGIPNVDTVTRELRDVGKILNLPADFRSRTASERGTLLRAALDTALPAFGGKASHFSGFPHMDSSKVPYPKAFGIPVYYYFQFMKQNGFDLQVDEFLKDATFTDNPKTRDEKLKKLRKAMETAPVDSTFSATLMAKLNTEFPGVKMRFRSSTNAEDLDGFTGAGLYTSKSGEAGDTTDILNAIREVWSSVWYFRAFEERTYRKIDHKAVGMAMLVHNSYPTEEATGVAITANIYDQTGMEPGFYVNVQYNGASVVLPDTGVTTDQFVYNYSFEGKPITYIGHSNLLPAGKSTVLTPAQINKLGISLLEIHEFYQPLYGKDATKKYAMDTEFKFDQPLGNPNGEPVLYMKQCRPYY
jgi:hypothetical protein